MPFTPLPNVVQATPTDPSLTASATMVMMGLGVAGAGGGWSAIPGSTGRFFLSISGIVLTSVSTDGAKYQIYHGTGAAPANGAALTGTADGSNPSVTSLVSSNLAVPFGLSVVISGLVIGTAVWFDLALAAVTGGNASVRTLSCQAIEI